MYQNIEGDRNNIVYLPRDNTLLWFIFCADCTDFRVCIPYAEYQGYPPYDMQWNIMKNKHAIHDFCGALGKVNGAGLILQRRRDKYVSAASFVVLRFIVYLHLVSAWAVDGLTVERREEMSRICMVRSKQMTSWTSWGFLESIVWGSLKRAF